MTVLIIIDALSGLAACRSAGQRPETPRELLAWL